MSAPMTPDEVALKVAKALIPNEVVDAVNECLTRYYDPKLTVIMQEDLVEEILTRFPCGSGMTENELIKRDWLDFEPLYRARGWHVTYIGDATGRHWIFRKLES